MADDKPTPPDRKARFLAPLAIAAAVTMVLVVIVARQPTETPPPPAPIVPVATPPLAIKVAPLPLTRAELIDHARAIGAAFAASGKLPTGPDAMIGRRFALRIAFGCNGISGGAPGSQASLTYDSENQSVTLSARPGDWTALPLVQSLPNAAAIEAVEGFWLPRPWMDGNICPAQSGYTAPATPTPPTAPTLGLAQIYETGGSRLSRHADHPYEFTRKLASDAAAILNHSYRLELEGRVTGFANHQALQCWVESPDHQPLCVYGVALDHVAFVDGETGEVLAKWSD
jgi:hypothetical protein